jgi:hypothetical protein
MNMQITGYNEALIAYVLAASSPTHSVPKAVYDQGWAQNGAIRNGKMFEGITLPLGVNYGGPLFFTHYSFLGIDPRNLQDQYANYWQQNVAHTEINNRYCIKNPNEWNGFSAQCWGLTASDDPSGYEAASPTNDLGTIAPTAALSSIPILLHKACRQHVFTIINWVTSCGGRMVLLTRLTCHKRGLIRTI